MARVIGLTGGIATGKSSVARVLKTLGATLVDADEIVHEIQAPGQPLLDEIAAAFGPEIVDPDGVLDRAALANLVFRDGELRARLEAIVHPVVRAVMAERVAIAQREGAPLIVLDIPLLFEGRAEATQSAATAHANEDRRSSALPIDVSVLVYAPESAQITRQMRRDGCDRREALRIIRAQLPIEEKKAMADVVIDNSGSAEDTEAQARALFERLTAADA